MTHSHSIYDEALYDLPVVQQARDRLIFDMRQSRETGNILIMVDAVKNEYLNGGKWENGKTVAELDSFEEAFRGAHNMTANMKNDTMYYVVEKPSTMTNQAFSDIINEDLDNWKAEPAKTANPVGKHTHALHKKQRGHEEQLREEIADILASAHGNPVDELVNLFASLQQDRTRPSMN